MKRRNRANSSSLFLLELILAILFFSIASAVCVQFFVKSHILSTEARELNASVTAVSTIAELTSVSDDTSTAVEQILTQFPDAVKTSASEMQIYYDEDFQACTETKAAYVLHVRFTQKEFMLNTALEMTDLTGEKSIYALDTAHHLQRRDNHGL